MTSGISYAYDSNGNILTKTDHSTNKTITYGYSNQTWADLLTSYNGQTITYNDRMYGFSYNGTMYYYQFNLQGDVTGIYDANGQLVVEYKYDAWGKVLSITGTLANTIGKNNPIRYRGYYYDNETGFYHLNSRYYDPETGRFLNADNVISGTGDSVQGYNLFVYCFNNPINMNDPDGNWPKWIKNSK